MQDDATPPPDPVRAADSGVRGLPSERAVAKIARRAAWTSGSGVAFVTIMVVIAGTGDGRGPQAFATVVFLPAAILLGLGWIFSLIAWRQQRRLGLPRSAGVKFGRLAPLIAIAIGVAGGVFVAQVAIPHRARASAAEVWETALSYDWEHDGAGLATLVEGGDVAGLPPGENAARRARAIQRAGLQLSRFDGAPDAWFVDDVELHGGRNRRATLTLRRHDGSGGPLMLRVKRDVFGVWLVTSVKGDQ